MTTSPGPLTPETDRKPQAPAAVFASLTLLVGVLAVGAAAVFVRKADAPGVPLAFWRCLLGGALLLGIVVVTRRPLPPRSAWPRCLAAGACLGAHFGLWNVSLQHTSVAQSVVLVCLQPVFVVVFAWVFLRERTAPRVLLGIGVALAGAAATALADGGSAAAAPLLGNTLALAGAVAIAAYVTVGRGVVHAVDVWGYSAFVTLSAAAALLPVALWMDAPLMLPTPTSWAWLLVLAVFPQVLGHTALNVALRTLPAAVVSGAILLEPAIATALAWLFLAETPPAWAVGGGVVTLAGLLLLLSPAQRDA